MYLIDRGAKEVEDLRGGKRMLKAGSWHFGIGTCMEFKDNWTVERKKCLRSSTVLEGMKVKILEWLGCIECTICIISLVIKWEKLWSHY